VVDDDRTRSAPNERPASAHALQALALAAHCETGLPLLAVPRPGLACRSASNRVWSRTQSANRSRGVRPQAHQRTAVRAQRGRAGVPRREAVLVERRAAAPGGRARAQQRVRVSVQPAARG